MKSKEDGVKEEKLVKVNIKRILSTLVLLGPTSSMQIAFAMWESCDTKILILKIHVAPNLLMMTDAPADCFYAATNRSENVMGSLIENPC